MSIANDYLKRRMQYESNCTALSVVCARHRFRSVPHQCDRSSFYEVMNMEGFANLISMMDYVLDTKRKRHITGGLLLSAAALFAGLAITVISAKDEDIVDVEEIKYERY